MELIAYDGSGSTGGMNFYHDETQRILSRHPEAVVLFWDSHHRVITRNEMATINKGRKGFGGTVPSGIAHYVKQVDFHGHLIIITDGEVSANSIDECDRALGAWNFSQVTAHLIGSRVNMSVTCPFTRTSPHAVFTYRSPNFEQVAATAVSTADLESLRRLRDISSIEEYLSVADEVERSVIARTMGVTGDPSLRDEILAMKKRLVANEARLKGGSSTVSALETALQNGDTTNATLLANLLTREYYGNGEEGAGAGAGAGAGDDRSWSARINKLVGMCEGALRSAFDLSGIKAAVASDRVRRAATAAAAPVAAVPLVEDEGTEPTGTFSCPISLDDTNDVLLLVTADEGAVMPVLAGLDKDIVNSLIDCPLNLFNYPEVVARFKARLDHPISLAAFKQAAMAGEPFIASPLTRRPVWGGICLGESEAHCEATRATLAYALTGGKLVGNQDLWFACVWLLVENGELEYLTPILALLRAQMLWRARHHSTFISLNGLPEFPTTRVPLQVATWYVLASPAFDPVSPRADRDVLRVHLPHLKPLKQLLTLIGYQLPDGVDEHTERLRVLLAMLSWVKRDRLRLPNLVAALTQSCVGVNMAAVAPEVASREQLVEFVPVDGAASEEQRSAVLLLLPELYRHLDVATLCGLAAMVDPNLAAAGLCLPMVWQPPVLPEPVVSWSYGVTPVPSLKLDISHRTCRPVSRVCCGAVSSEGGENETWQAAAERVFAAPVSSLLSSNAYFGRFVEKYEQYPGRDSFITYLHNRCCVYGRYKTLPAAVEQFFWEHQAEYAGVVEAVEAPEFARRHRESYKLDDRLRLEDDV